MESKSTQLAEARPRLDAPLRIAIPVNTPSRKPRRQNDDIIHDNVFSPKAFTIARNHKITLSNHSNSGPRSELKVAVDIIEQDATIGTTITDYTVLALSSKRADKKDVEASAYASLGVIYDDQANFPQAIKNYKAYLEICENISDDVGASCAYNCIGVDYMLMANPEGSILTIRENDQVLEHLNEALSYHLRHLEIASDEGAKFVANTNLGMCYAMLSDLNQSVRHHQNALRIAIKLQTLYGQSIAVGNLGLIALTRNDYTTAKTCFDQHLQLVQALADSEAEINGWKLLANLSKLNENYIDALEALNHARIIAEREDYRNELRQINCLLGVTQGTLDFMSFTEQVGNDSC